MGFSFNTGAKVILLNLRAIMSSFANSPQECPSSLRVKIKVPHWPRNHSISTPITLPLSPTLHTDLRAFALTTPFTCKVLLLVNHKTYPLTDFGTLLNCHVLRGDVFRLSFVELPLLVHFIFFSLAFTMI